MAAATYQDSHSATALATALLELAAERNELDSTAADMKAIGEAIAGTPQLQAFLDSPSIKDQERSDVLERTLLTGASSLVGSFIRLLVSKGQVGELAAVSAAVERLMDVRQGKVEVDVTVARALNDRQLDEVRQRVSAAIQKQAIVKQHVDESILGGIIVRFGDKLIDGSVRSQLKAIEDRMLAATV